MAAPPSAPPPTAPARPKGGKAPVFADGSTLAERAAQVARSPEPALSARAAADEIVRISPTVEKASSRLTHFRAALRAAGAPPAAVEAAKRPALTTRANQLRFERFGSAGGRAETGIRPPPFWGYAAVRRRLERADPARPAERGDVLDVMVALAARPSEVKTLVIGPDGLVRGFSKGRGAAPRPYAGMLPRERADALLRWVQTAIRLGRLPDPGTLGSKPYRALLDPHGLKPKDLRNLGAEYAARAAGAPTDAARLEVRRLALRHSAARTPSQYYSIVRDEEGAPGPPGQPGEPRRGRARAPLPGAPARPGRAARKKPGAAPVRAQLPRGPGGAGGSAGPRPAHAARAGAPRSSTEFSSGRKLKPAPRRAGRRTRSAAPGCGRGRRPKREGLRPAHDSGAAVS